MPDGEQATLFHVRLNRYLPLHRVAPNRDSRRISPVRKAHDPDTSTLYPMSDQPLPSEQPLQSGHATDSNQTAAPESNASNHSDNQADKAASRPSRPSRRKRSKLPVDAPDVVSPCISICEMDQARGVCKGCYRTLEEIATWSRMDNQQRWDIVQSLRDRRRALG